MVGSGAATLAPVKSPSPTPLPLPFIHLQTTSNKIEVLFESLLHSNALATGRHQTQFVGGSERVPAILDLNRFNRLPKSKRASPTTCRTTWTKSRGTTRRLATCAGSFWFTASAATTSPATCCSADETATRARQPSQHDAKAPLNSNNKARGDALAEHPPRWPWRTTAREKLRITSLEDESSSGRLQSRANHLG